MKQIPTKISVIVTTYNWPYALRVVLEVLCSQKTNIPFEIIVADDGSKKEAAQLIAHVKKKNAIPVKHVWQSDVGWGLYPQREFYRTTF